MSGRPVRLSFRSVALTISTLTISTLLLSATVAPAEQWSQFRGPNRDGQITMFEVPSKWPDTPKTVWKVEVGEGQASPVVYDGKIYLMARQGEEEVAMALSLDSGKVLWKQGFPTPYTAHQAAMKFGKGPRSTPIVADGVACFLGVDARFSCHDAGSGKVLWVRDFSDKSDIAETFCGSSMTPLVRDGVIFVHLGDDRAGRLFAADLRTGEEKWGWEGQGPGYASPMMLEIEGVRQLVTLAATHLLSFDPQTGELLWERPYPDKWKENIPSPLVVGQRILISDFENGTLSLWPRKTEKGWVVEDHWHNKELTLRMASPVTDGERVYGFSNRRKGQLFALDPATGEVIWQDEGRGGENAVLAMSGGWLFVSNTEAELKIAKWENGSLKEVRTYEIADSPVWAQPAWVKDGLLVKDERHLTRLALVEEAPKAAAKQEKEGP